MSNRSRFLALLATVLLFMLLAVPMYAQFNASLQGTITDPSGALVPNAKITITNQETGVTRSSVSTQEGFYRIGALPPGRYMVTIEAASFEKSVTKNVQVSAETNRTFDSVLKAGTRSDVVTVSADAATLKTESANVDRTLSTTDITSLPSFGRDPYELLKTAPGVFGDSSRSSNGQAMNLVNNSGPGGSASSIFQTENQVQISGNGQRVSSNNYEVDGVSVNSLQWGGAAVLTPNIESVKEVNVTTSSYSAEDGRNSGVQVKVVSQTGTNAWHGSGLFKYDEPGLNAFNRYGGFNNAKPVRVENKYRQYAGSVGGAIIKDKLFFFSSYEGLHQSNNTTSTPTWVTTPQYIQSLLNSRQGTPIATYFGTSGLTPRIRQVLTPSCPPAFGANCKVVNGGIDIGSITGTYNNYVKMGTTGGGLDGVPDLQYVTVGLPSKNIGNQYNGRIDYNLSTVDQIAVSTYMTYFNSTGSNSDAAGMPSADMNKKPVNSLVTLLWNHTFSPTLLNEARLNFSRFSYNQVDSNTDVNFGIPRIKVEGMPVNLLYFGADRGETTPGIFAQNQYEFRDVISKVEGARTWKFGFEMRKEQDNNNLLGGARPIYSFSGLWNLANGAPIYEGINADPRTGKPADAQRHFRTSNFAIFAQNDWRLTQKLTVNLGLRWEYFSPLNDEGGQNVNLVLGQGANALTNAQIKVGGSLTNKDLNNFAPRLGFAYSPTSKLVVRGGAGVAYNRLSDALFTNTHGNPPYFARYNLCCGTGGSAVDGWGTPFADNTIQFALGSSKSPSSYPVNPALAAGFDPTTGLPVNGRVEIWGAPQDLRTPYVYLYSLDTEYQLPSNLIASVGYQGSLGRKLIRIVNQNFIYAAVNPKFQSAYFPTGDITSNFNSLNLGVRRNFTNGLKFDAKYRWSKSMDELSNEGPGAQTNQTYPRDLRTEYGPSDFDATHYFVANAIYRLPFFKNKTDLKGMLLGGWEVSSIFTFHSGFPWTPKTNTQGILFPGGDRLSPIRPIGYVGGAGTSADTDTFMRDGGNFPGGGKAYFDISNFGVPGIGRNSFRGPRYSSVDMTLGKNVPLQKLGLPERAALDLRMNVFNVFNKLNLNPLGFYSAGTIIEDSHFGMSDGAQAGRVIELQARFSF